MVGFYRLILAIIVVQAHTLAAGYPAQFAVFSFYVLSGFLMTLILNESYGFGLANFFRFWSNRLLRLYPAYWVVAAAAAAHILLIGPLNAVHGNLGLPDSAYGVFANVTLIGLAGFDFSQIPAMLLVPNAWSLGIELFGYFLLSVYFARNERRAAGMLAIGLAITAVALARGLAEGPPIYDMQNHYAVVQAALIPFAAGSLAYFHRRSSWFAYSPGRLAALGALWIASEALAVAYPFHAFVTGLYAAVILNVFLVPMMFNRDDGRTPSILANTAGRIAYPVFVAHIPVGALVYLYLGPWSERGVVYLLTTLAATVAVSLAISYGIEGPVEQLRARVRRGFRAA